MRFFKKSTKTKTKNSNFTPQNFFLIAPILKKQKWISKIEKCSIFQFFFVENWLTYLEVAQKTAQNILSQSMLFLSITLLLLDRFQHFEKDSKVLTIIYMW